MGHSFLAVSLWVEANDFSAKHTNTMRFTASTVVVALAFLFFTTTQACLILSGYIHADGKLEVSIWDNGAFRCWWIGQYRRGTQQFMTCSAGFAAWINLPPGVPAGTVAYAYDNFGVRFANNYSQEGTSYGLHTFMYDCSAAQAASAMGMDGSDMLSLPPSVSDGSESTTTSVATKTKAARPFKA